MTTETTINKIVMPDFFFDKLCKLIEGDENRMDFLPSKCGASFMTFENAVYTIANRLCPDYQGGYWEFAQCQNLDSETTKEKPPFFMFPSSEKAFEVSTCYSSKIVDGRILGICVCVCVFSELSFAYHNRNDSTSQLYANYYHGLKGAFYDVVDQFLYNPDPETEITQEQREQVEALSSAFFSILD